MSDDVTRWDISGTHYCVADGGVLVMQFEDGVLVREWRHPIEDEL
jgi:hypothetical protein